ncbi:hypothetical protein AB5J51_39270 [Streptomyces sp. R33]|uniref:NAD-glutamate dehydrogenase N-terminal ACT1 domain-containing protein n=1 Tax=Streptomyces sp. R33 TaxID=3238629 RepID=A0AB39YEK7_9ACTN
MRLRTPTVEQNGRTSSHSVAAVVTDDMPFLLGSVTNEPSRQGRGIHVVIHPQVVVRDDVTGAIVRRGIETPHSPDTSGTSPRSTTPCRVHTGAGRY